MKSPAIIERTLGRGFARWLLYTPWWSIRVHRFEPAFADDEGLHDHHWPFVTVVLRGGYDDVTRSGVECLRRGAVRFRRASHLHRVEVHRDGALTLLVTGRKVRERSIEGCGR